MLAFGLMEARRDPRWGVLAAIFAAALALQCGREQFDLLETGQAGSNSLDPNGGTGGGTPDGATGGTLPPPPPNGGTPGEPTGGRTGFPPPSDGGEAGSNDPPCALSSCPFYCRTDRDCAGNPAGPYCGGGRCRECRWLDMTRYVGCSANQFCLLPGNCRDFCDENGECDSGLACRPDPPVCVECIGPNDCADRAEDGYELCGFSNVCVQCFSEQDCQSGQRCSLDGECICSSCPGP